MRSKSEQARFPRIRREFATLEEMGEVLNRSKGYVAARMVGKQHFTRRDKKMLLAYLGVDIAMVGEWFPEEVHEGNDQGGQDALLPMPNVRRIS